MGMSRIFWDANLFIYLFEEYNHKDLSKRTIALRKKMIDRGDQLVTSTMTVGEVLVKPVKVGDSATSRFYEDSILGSALVIPFDLKAARIYANLRATRRRSELHPPDAIQLACAASVGVDLFITNDSRLNNERVPGIQFVTSLDRAPL
jgi:predicted nucleic acid-binding protein